MKWRLLKILATILSVQPALAQCGVASGSRCPGVAGEIHAFAQWDPDGAGPLPVKLVAAGLFSAAGPVAAQNVAALGTSGFENLGSLPGLVRCLTVHNGELYAGGDFPSSNNDQHVARWTGTTWLRLRTPESFNGIYALASFNGSLYAGTDSGTATESRLLRFNGSQFVRLPTGPRGPVYALHANASMLYVGGSFNLVDSTGFYHGNITSFNGNTFTRLLGASGSGPNGFVYALAEYAGYLYVGGSFETSSLGFDSRNIVSWRFSSSGWINVGSLDKASGASAVYGLYLGTGSMGNAAMFAAGAFDRSGPTALKNAARWVNQQTWQSVGTAAGSDLNDASYAVSEHNGFAHFGGRFSEVTNGSTTIPLSGIARWSAATTWTRLDNGFNGPIYTFGMYDGLLHAGGSFTSTPNASTTNLAKLNGQFWQSYPGFAIDGPVRAIGSFGNIFGPFTLVIGGEFTPFPGIPNTRGLAIHTGTQWDALGTGVNDDVYALSSGGQGIFMVGDFSFAGGNAFNSMATYSRGLWSSYGSGVTGTVYDFETHNGRLVVGGQLSTAGGVAVGNVVEWNGAQWNDISQSTFEGPVYCLQSANGLLYAGGDFETGSTGYFASLDGEFWGRSSVIKSPVYAMTTVNGRLVIGGGLNIPSQFDRTYLAIQSGGGGFIPVGPRLNGDVRALHYLGNKLHIGGQFTADSESGLAWNHYGSFTVSSLGPAITDQPDPVICAGSTAILTVGATGGSQLGYWWFKNDIYLSDGPTANGSVVSGSHTATLVITNASPQNSGEYGVRVFDECGELFSNRVVVFVCAADFNCDGVLDFFDYLDFVDAFSSNVPAADFNHDSVIDFFDYLDFVDAFSIGC